MVITKKVTPRIRNVALNPYVGINSLAAKGPKMAELTPYAPESNPSPSRAYRGTTFHRRDDDGAAKPGAEAA